MKSVNLEAQNLPYSSMSGLKYVNPNKNMIAVSFLKEKCINLILARESALEIVIAGALFLLFFVKAAFTKLQPQPFFLGHFQFEGKKKGVEHDWPSGVGVGNACIVNMSTCSGLQTSLRTHINCKQEIGAIPIKAVMSYLARRRYQI